MTPPGAFSGFGAINGCLFSAGLEKGHTIFVSLLPICSKHAMTSASLRALTNFLRFYGHFPLATL